MKTGKGSVNRFVDANGVKHHPGDIVDLPVSYLGQAWLEPLEKPKKAVAPVAKSEPAPAAPTAPTEEKPAVPLPAKTGKKSRSS